MPIEDFIINVYCCVDDNWDLLTEGKRLRQRGYVPKLSDQDVITMEIVGESLGMEMDKGIGAYFRLHWLKWFPQLSSRANFSKQVSALATLVTGQRWFCFTACQDVMRAWAKGSASMLRCAVP